jgi:quinol monooxygenase YgiN
MEFVQVMECRTSKVDELTALEAEWRQATEGKRTLRRSILARDRNDPDRYFVLAFFDSYDSAMQNSNLPETAKFGALQAEVLDEPMQFTDLDILEDQT